jgi:predicted N-acetyltransferase YhbS
VSPVWGSFFLPRWYIFYETDGEAKGIAASTAEPFRPESEAELPANLREDSEMK